MSAENGVVIRGGGDKSAIMAGTSFAPGAFEKQPAGKLAKLEGIGNSGMNWSHQAKKG